MAFLLGNSYICHDAVNPTCDSLIDYGFDLVQIFVPKLNVLPYMLIKGKNYVAVIALAIQRLFMKND